METTFPNGEGKDTQEQINGVYDYLFVLLEQLRYTLFNLDGSNINQNALSEFIKNISEPIYAKIDDTDKNVNEISITAKGLDARLSDAEGDITQLDTTAKGLQVSVSNLDGAITNIKTDVNGLRATVSGKIDATQAQSIFDQSAQGFTLAATSGENGTSFELNYNGAQIASTGSIDLYVDAVNIYGTLTATKLRGGSISVVDDDDNECGTIQTTYASTSDNKLDISSRAMQLFAEDGSLFIASGWDRSNKYHASIEVDGNFEEVQIKGSVIPNADDVYNLGSPNVVWSAIYCSTNELNGSDRNSKNSIEALPEKYVRMLELVEPKRYKLNNGTSGRYHTGFIAQEVEIAMRACGIESKEFAGWAAAKREDRSETYFLRESEFIPILWAKVREQEERL
ncbi:tail fiber domain-containing protein, partial [Alistipes putredinis]|uniref:tail fiber domain-containing protein n=1 Tax=Alistipes putredinis TaxID=28117 RepID=UPI0040294CA0